MNSPSPNPPAGPGVSVVIPCYNYAAYVGQAIDSALRQAYPNLEIIVVDDGSTDNSRAVITAYGAKVRYVHQANAGLSAARNTGINAATHDFVAFLDADDVWLPGYIERVMQCFNANPELGLVATQERYTDAAGVLLQAKNNALRLSGEITIRDILLGTRFFPSAVIARRAALIESGYFDTTLRSSEDRDMWIRVAARHRLHLIPEALVLIRKHGQNMSGHADRMRANQQRVIAKAWRAQSVAGANGFFWLKVMAGFYYNSAVMYLGTRRLGNALGDCLRSLLCWPLPMTGRELGSTINWVRLRTLARVCLYRFRVKAEQESVLAPDPVQSPQEIPGP